LNKNYIFKYKISIERGFWDDSKKPDGDPLGALGEIDEKRVFHAKGQLQSYHSRGISETSGSR
jgi:hypothetical protein